MNKIAAYQIALERIEIEKRAEYLVDTYGTCEGLMPAAYLHAFDELEKNAINVGDALQYVGKKVTGGIYGLGKALGGTGSSGRRAGVGGYLMDIASGIGGRAGSGSSKDLFAAYRNMDPTVTGRQYIKDRHKLQKALGAATLGTGVAVPAAAYMLSGD